MPFPIFIICSQSGADDKPSGLVSLFNVIDKLQFSGTPQPGASPLVELRITAVWGQEPEDENQQFEFEIYLNLPPENQEFPVGNGPFEFSKPRQRITGRIMGGLPLMASGVMQVHARIRKVGTDQWYPQAYPILIEQCVDVQNRVGVQDGNGT